MTHKTAGDFQFIEDHFFEFRDRSPDVPLADFTSQHALRNLAQIGSLVRIDIQFFADRGQKVDVGKYFIQFPELLEFPELTNSILDEDFKSQFRLGSCVDWESYHTGHPVLDRIIRQREASPSQKFTRKLVEVDVARGDSDSLVGTRLKNYEVTEVISRGRRADVFRATDVNLQRVVALKVSREISRTADREARFLAKLEHRNILAVHEEFEFESMQVIVMNFADGPSLAQLIDHWHPRRETKNDFLPIPERWNKKGRQAIAVAVEMMIAIANAVQHAHERSVWHCDIKPANILMAADGNPLLMDFDIAINAGTERSSPGGTIGYASPEQHDFLIRKDPFSRGQIDHRTDLYSMGVVLFEMLTGRIPKRKEVENVFDTVSRVSGSDRVLASIVQKCLQTDRSHRYQNADALSIDLQNWLDGRPLVFADDQFFPERTVRWLRRYPVGVVGVTFFLLMVVVWGVQSNRRITLAENTLDQMERKLSRPGMVDAESLARSLIEVNSVASSKDWMSFLFHSRRQRVQQRIQQVVSDLASLETRELLETSRRVRSPWLGEATRNSSVADSVTHLDQVNVNNIAGEGQRETGGANDGEICVLFERAMQELIGLANDASDKSALIAIGNRYQKALANLLPSLTKTQGLELLNKEAAPATLAGVIADRLHCEHEGRDLEGGSIEWHLLGVVALHQNWPDMARTCFQRSAQLRFQAGQLPQLLTVRHLANSYLLEDDDVNSKKYLEMVRQLDPRDSFVLHRLALLHEKQGEFGQAIRYLKSAVELDSTQAVYHADLGAVYIRAGQLGPAAQELEKAIAMGHDQVDVLMNQAIVHYLNGSIGDAIASLDALVIRFPADPAPRRLLAKLRSRQK